MYYLKIKYMNDVSSIVAFIKTRFKVHFSFKFSSIIFKLFQVFSKFTLFADYSTLPCRLENKVTVSMLTVLSNYIINVFNCFLAKKAKVNTEKCKLIHSSYRQKLPLPPIKINSSCMH